MITHCKFCPNKKLNRGNNCEKCPYQYMTFSSGDGWMFVIGKFYIDVFSKSSDIYTIMFDAGTIYPREFIVNLPWQILPSSFTEEEMQVYLTFL